MLSELNGSPWMDDNTNREHQQNTSTTSLNTTNNSNLIIESSSCELMMETKEEMGFKSMLEVAEEDWYVVGNNSHNNNNHSNVVKEMSFSTDGLLLHHHHHHNQVDSSSSCSPSSSVFNNMDPSQVPYFMQPINKQQPPHHSSLSSLLANVVSNNNNNPLDHGFDLGEIGFLDNQVATATGNFLNRGSGGLLLGNCADFGSMNNQMGGAAHNLPQFGSSPHQMLQLPETGFRGFDEGNGKTGLILNRPKLLRPLESYPSVGAQPTLFQKRAALRKNLSGGDAGNLGILGGVTERDKGKKEMIQSSDEDNNEKNKRMMLSSNGGDSFLDDLSIDGSVGLNYDSDEFTENSTKLDEICKAGGGGLSSNANSGVTGGAPDQKGKKKGLPAKNLMAERRRRKKLNDRLYMLRSVVPKISKMDRASILGDAIEYLKELLQRISDLHNELESTPPGSSSLTPTATTPFHPLTPTPSALSGHIKDKLCPSPNGQPARVEVRVREGRAVNIHMFCGRRPGLLLSTMKAMDNLGLDIQQAVISCFNGFAMDIFRAEQCKEGEDVHPEQIKAVLLDSAGFHGMI
ncbi:unnamed protein product [Linum tenue]|uniref:BHLH domain-containing protein n=1 Tax=Linum tenue TaxID=586396 RepID=A0AAV0MJ12_9ROSI|nr:unnamed protein product [Linum tenue]